MRVSLEATVEVESGDGEWHEDVTFGTAPIAGATRLEPGQRQSVPFRLAVPWQCPITTIDGWHLRGMRVGVQTRVDIAGAVDPGDLDPVTVTPLPVQRAVLDALVGLGFRFLGADVERGRVPGSDLPFHQEVEFAPPPALRGRINELEVTFLAVRTASTSCWRPTGAAGCSPRVATPSGGSAWATATPTAPAGPRAGRRGAPARGAARLALTTRWVRWSTP